MMQKIKGSSVLAGLAGLVMLALVFGFYGPGQLLFTSAFTGPTGTAGTGDGSISTDSAGNVGIGATASTTARFYVSANASNTYGIQILNPSGDSIFRLGRGTFATSTVFRLGTDGGFVLANMGSDILTIKSGNVGIGTTTPAVKFHVVDSTGSFRFESSNNAQIELKGTGGSGRQWELQSRTDNGKFYLNDATAGLARLAIASSGDIGIGTTSPLAKLDVSGQLYSRSYNAGGGSSIDWNSGNVQIITTAPGAITFTNMQDGGAYSLVVQNSTSGTYTFSQSGLTFKFNPANGNTTVSKDTIYTFIRASSTVYVSWVPGF